jgi:hypothetical protein
MSFDDLFGARAQRHAFRRYMEGLLLPAERNKTLTALANTEPVVGAQHKEAQSLQWFLSESRCDPEEVNERRLKLLLLEEPNSAADDVLVIDEHGDRKWGKRTAHVGRQWLANIGKIENGVVSVTSLLADERIYYPLDFEPYTPSHHFEGVKNDPHFRTKLKIASQLVEKAVERHIPFRAVGADSFYGEDEGFKQSLSELGVGYVLALKPSHAWWHRVGEIGSPWEAAVAAGRAWEDERHPGDWVKVMRRFKEGHEQQWWALEVDVGPYGPQRDRRSVVATTDPKELPDKATWYLATNLPHPDSKRATDSELEAANLAEIIRLYGLRMWVEQSYKQVKDVLGWSDYQVRSDLAIRRHWQMVCVAFSFCWWAYGHLPASPEEPTEAENAPTASVAGRGKKEDTEMLAGGFEGGKRVVGALCHAEKILEGVLRDAPAQRAKRSAA